MMIIELNDKEVREIFRVFRTICLASSDPIQTSIMIKLNDALLEADV